MLLRHWKVAACKGARKEADVMAAAGGAGASGQEMAREGGDEAQQ